MNTPDQYSAILAIDWADRRHDQCLQVTGNDTLESSVLAHQIQAIED